MIKDIIVVFVWAWALSTLWSSLHASEIGALYVPIDELKLNVTEVVVLPMININLDVLTETKFVVREEASNE